MPLHDTDMTVLSARVLSKLQEWRDACERGVEAPSIDAFRKYISHLDDVLNLRPYHEESEFAHLSALWVAPREYFLESGYSPDMLGDASDEDLRVGVVSKMMPLIADIDHALVERDARLINNRADGARGEDGRLHSALPPLLKDNLNALYDLLRQAALRNYLQEGVGVEENDILTALLLNRYADFDAIERLYQNSPVALRDIAQSHVREGEFAANIDRLLYYHPDLFEQIVELQSTAPDRLHELAKPDMARMLDFEGVDLVRLNHIYGMSSEALSEVAANESASYDIMRATGIPLQGMVYLAEYEPEKFDALNHPLFSRAIVNGHLSVEEVLNICDRRQDVVAALTAPAVTELVLDQPALSWSELSALYDRDPEMVDRLSELRGEELPSDVFQVRMDLLYLPHLFTYVRTQKVALLPSAARDFLLDNEQMMASACQDCLVNGSVTSASAAGAALLDVAYSMTLSPSVKEFLQQDPGVHGKMLMSVQREYYHNILALLENDAVRSFLARYALPNTAQMFSLVRGDDKQACLVRVCEDPNLSRVVGKKCPGEAGQNAVEISELGLDKISQLSRLLGNERAAVFFESAMGEFLCTALDDASPEEMENLMRLFDIEENANLLTRGSILRFVETNSSMADILAHCSDELLGRFAVLTESPEASAFFSSQPELLVTLLQSVRGDFDCAIRLLGNEMVCHYFERHPEDLDDVLLLDDEQIELVQQILTNPGMNAFCVAHPEQIDGLLEVEGGAVASRVDQLLNRSQVHLFFRDNPELVYQVANLPAESYERACELLETEDVRGYLDVYPLELFNLVPLQGQQVQQVLDEHAAAERRDGVGMHENGGGPAAGDAAEEAFGIGEAAFGIGGEPFLAVVDAQGDPLRGVHFMVGAEEVPRIVPDGMMVEFDDVEELPRIAPGGIMDVDGVERWEEERGIGRDGGRV